MAGTVPAVKLEGVSRLVRTLREAEGKLDDLKDVNAKIATLAAVAIAAEAPRRSGRLAASVRGNRAARRATVSAGRASVPYAGPVHWGWPRRRPPAKGGPIAPNEFGVRGLERIEPTAERLYIDGIQRILSDVKGV